MQRIPQDLRVQVDISPGPPLRLTFYRLLALPPGDARSLIALCSRDVLSTRSAEEAGDYLRARLAPFFHVAWFARACEKTKTCGFSHVAEPCDSAGDQCLSRHKVV